MSLTLLEPERNLLCVPLTGASALGSGILGAHVLPKQKSCLPSQVPSPRGQGVWPFL